MFLYTPNIFIEWTYSPPVICNDHAFTEFIQGEERCLKFINQDLTFLQSSSIPSSFSNISNEVSASVKVREPSHIQLLTRIPQDHINSPPSQTVEPVLGFTPAEICQAQVEPKLTVQQILEIKLDIGQHLCKSTQKVSKEAKKLAEEF